jgi:DNA-binding LacI/PurR family transcriptional regulator
MATAKWKEIAEQIRSEIYEKHLCPDDRLPSESEIAKRWQVSRMTAHRAMTYLQDQGVIIRHQRRGSVVASTDDIRKNVVAMLFHNSNDFLEIQYLLGVRSGLLDNDHLLFWNTCNDPKKEAAYLRQAAREADGIICFPTCAAENTHLMQRIADGGTPIVCLDRIPSDLRVDAVLTDNYMAALNALRFMRELGHTRIAYFSEYQMEVSATQERYRAYMDAMGEAGIEETALYVRKLLPALGGHPDLLIQTVCDALESMMGMPHPPTAIFCMHDYYLAAVLESCDILGYRIPEDMEILSFNDCPPMVPRFARSVHRIVQQTHKIGHIAALRLQRRLNGEVMNFETIQVPVDFYPASMTSERTWPG